MRYDPRDKDNFEPPLSEAEYLDYMKHALGCRLVKKVSFTLEVEDPSLAGTVGGKYKEDTTDLPTLKRKLKRMLKCKKLNIVDRRLSV